MHRSENLELETCADCGAPLDAASERGYALDEQRALCFACATKRGGAYDEQRDLWVTPPDVAGLAPREDD
jgi:recombinational DNA repair protein (RecF pathway)